MKKLIVLLFLFMLLPFALALEEGQILTQQQIDNFDVNQITASFLQCQEGNVELNQLIIRKHFSCLNLQKNDDDNTYEVYRQDAYIDISVESLQLCVNNYPLEYCQALYVQYLVGYFDAYLESIKNNILEWQTLDVPQSWLDWFNDIFGGF